MDEERSGECRQSSRAAKRVCRFETETRTKNESEREREKTNEKPASVEEESRREVRNEEEKGYPPLNKQNGT